MLLRNPGGGDHSHGRRRGRHRRERHEALIGRALKAAPKYGLQLLPP
jgi:hypothetical protein